MIRILPSSRCSSTNISSLSRTAVQSFTHLGQNGTQTNFIEKQMHYNLSDLLLSDLSLPLDFLGVDVKRHLSVLEPWRSLRFGDQTG